MNEENKITVLIVEPMKVPKIVEIPETLESMQSIVDGRIQEIMPFDDEVALVCNEEGKLNELPLNRAIYNDDGQMIDIISGKFFICSAPFTSEKFESLSKEQQEKYTTKFKDPEMFVETENGLKIISTTQKNKNYER